MILASGSPRRRELLSLLGLKFEVRTMADVDESYPNNMPAEQVPEYLAGMKCDAQRPYMSARDLVITADTLVINKGVALGKPSTPEQARDMLHDLSGRVHHVITGVAVATSEVKYVSSAITEVEFAMLSDEEIDDYVCQYNPLDKAGAYGIQEWIGCIGVKRINGSFYNVMGLPLHILYTMLKKF